MRFWCAYCTAAQIFMNITSRAVVSRRRVSQYSSIGCPSTNSIAKYGRPSGVVPPSSSPDVGMVEAGENLALVAEAADDGVGVPAALEHLERDALLERVVAADGEVDRTHPPASQFPDEAVWTDPQAVDVG
jgi:hypothetical protein